MSHADETRAEQLPPPSPEERVELGERVSPVVPWVVALALVAVAVVVYAVLR